MVSLLWVSPRSGYSALAGGLISAVSSSYLAGRILGFDGTTPPARMLRAFYVGEVVKIVMTMALFILAIVLLKVDALFMLLAYVLTLPVYWFALLAPGPRIEKDH